jgi:hypothetical protein
VDFATAALQNGVCITLQMCHIMIVSHECSMIKYESNKKADVFCHFSNNIGFPIKGKLISTKSDL